MHSGEALIISTTLSVHIYMATLALDSAKYSSLFCFGLIGTKTYSLYSGLTVHTYLTTSETHVSSVNVLFTVKLLNVGIIPS